MTSNTRRTLIVLFGTIALLVVVQQLLMDRPLARDIVVAVPTGIVVALITIRTSRKPG